MTEHALTSPSLSISRTSTDIPTSVLPFPIHFSKCKSDLLTSCLKLFSVNSKVRFQTSNSAFMALADPSVLVRASVPPPEITGSSSGASSLLSLSSSLLDSEGNSDFRVRFCTPLFHPQYCLYLPSLSSAPLLYFEGSFCTSSICIQQFIEVSFKGQTLMQERIHESQHR